MDDLQNECNTILDDNSALEEDKIERVEDLVDRYIRDGQINKSVDKERLVLDILWRHRDKSPPVRSVEYKKAETPAFSSRNGVLESPPPSDPTKMAKFSQKKKSQKKSYVDFDKVVEESWTDDLEYAQSDAMTPFDMLRNILGEENTDQDIEHALEKYGFDIQNILKLLMPEAPTHEKSSDSDEEQEDDEGPSTPPKEKVVCKYFIQWGECLRSDCMYSHDLTSTICRFWLRGHCLAGDNCPFTHGIPEVVSAGEAQKKKEIKQKPQPVSLTADDFPALGQAKKKGSSPAPKPVSKFEFKPSKIFVPSFLKPQDEFAPAISAPAPTLKQLTNRKLVTANVNKVENKQAKLNLKSLNRNVVKVTLPQSIPWVQEDFGINKDYVSHRMSALRHADLRNKYLQLAAGSWHKNDGHAARALSKKGQMHNEKMIDDYTTASNILFEQRKQPHSEIYIDLHGMELDESTEKLRAILDQIEQEEKENPRPVYAICSSGHYFTRQKSPDDQLSKKVKDYLNENGYEWKEFKTAETKFGKLIGIDPWSHI